MPSSSKQHGGARPGSGPVRRHFHLSYGTAVLLRELTRSQAARKDVTEAELLAVLEDAIKAVVDRRLEGDPLCRRRYENE